MEVAHGPLNRSYTASSSVHGRAHPNVTSSPLVQTQTHGSQYSQHSHSSTSTGSTQMTAHSTLFPSNTSIPPPPPPPVNGGPVVASDNVMNQEADKDKSLYQICLNLRHRLSEVPGFEQHLRETEEDDEADDATDPVTSIWRCFRRGIPLMTIYNALDPAVPLTIDPSKNLTEQKIPKAATFKFLQACMTELRIPPAQCFLITDLYGDDTTGFVKVTKVVNTVLDALAEKGILAPAEPDSYVSQPGRERQGRTKRDYIVEEILNAERKYVQDLENLQQFKKQVEERGVVAGDSIHDIFLNLNALLDFQRRFLIRVEAICSLPVEQQKWGQLFLTYNESFRVYEPYAANKKRSEETALKEFDKLQLIANPVVRDWTTFSGFLFKPIQRLLKYPMFLDDLKKGDVDEASRQELAAGEAAAKMACARANAAAGREEGIREVTDLQNRVEDWKTHNIEHFGQLLQWGNFTVLKGDVAKDVEREYKVYLFERILLCCKEINPTKQKNKIMGTNKPAVDKKGKPRLELRGRIFMQNVTDVMYQQKPGSYTVQIFWKGDPGVENFVIRFTNDEVMKQWYAQVEAQRKYFEIASKVAQGRTVGTSATEFTSQRYLGVAIPNPYQQEDDNEDDEPELTTHRNDSGYHSELHISRNGSSTSLRSRSTTGDSGPPIAHSTNRQPMPRPVAYNQTPALTLQTQQLPNGAVSPGERAAPSYFSPTVDSPMSTRTSGSSGGNYPFPRQATPCNGWLEEVPSRFTAPAMGRTASREGHHTNGRIAQRPSLPAGAQGSSRLRSASSPDIHNPLGPGRRHPHIQNQPPVPDMPAHIPTHVQHRGPINRSQNNSPTNAANSLPVRVATQSPNLQRERLHHANTSVQHPHHYASDQVPVRTDSRPAMHAQATAPLQPSVSMHSSIPSNSQNLSNNMQLKVKVTFDNNYVTLVVVMNISYQSLVDRIDAKLSRFTSSSIGRGTLRLGYRDEDEDWINVRSDEDVQGAFEDWREQYKHQLLAGQMGEIQLECLSNTR
ncbi:MAG: hypothetical protein M1836_002607 [Candelina mexicana]|nr:MAG: hypothetical protein M1836_002607 [Candelina mexicana]